MASLLAARLCCAPRLRIAAIRKLPQQSIYRTFASDGRETVQRTARRATLRERAMAPAGEGGMLLLLLFF